MSNKKEKKMRTEGQRLSPKEGIGKPIFKFSCWRLPKQNDN